MATTAMKAAGVDSTSIGLVEAHATGTVLGDPIEFAGLSEALRSPSAAGWCALGSVKGNIGHLEAAAGIAGFIKVALAVERGLLPGTANLVAENPKLDVSASPFVLRRTTAPWPASPSSPRRGLVSSLGLGGTNANVVLEEPPAPLTNVLNDERTGHVLCMSAASPEALDALRTRYVEHLDSSAGAAFGDICFSANTGRIALPFRLAVTARGSQEAREILRDSRVTSGSEVTDVGSISRFEARRPTTAFLFSGQGNQYLGMGRGLYRAHPVFRATIDECDAMAREILGKSVVEIVFGDDEALLRNPATLHPALFMLQVALGRLLMSWGVIPDGTRSREVGCRSMRTV